jgi:hypothetical protein
VPHISHDTNDEEEDQLHFWSLWPSSSDGWLVGDHISYLSENRKLDS